MSRTSLAMAYLVTLVVVAVPLTVVAIPPLLDYPNHLARMHILADGGADPILAQHYEIHFGLQPNLGMDLIVPLAAKVVSLETAGRLFIVLIFVSTLFGVALIHRALFGVWSGWPLIGSLFLYNAMLLGGFMSFCLGLGLFLIGVGLWLHLREARFWLRLAIMVAIGLILFFCHLLALVFYGIVVLSFEIAAWMQCDALQRRRSYTWSDWMVLLVQFAVPLVLFCVWTANKNQDMGFSYAWLGKLRGPLLPVLNYSLVFDLALLVLVVGLFTLGLATRVIVFDKRVLGGFLLLLLLFVAAPSNGLTGAWADGRFVVAAAFVLVAATRFRTFGTRRAYVLVAMLLLVLTARTSVVAYNWSRLNKDLHEYQQAVARIEPGSRLMAAYPNGASQEYWRRGPNRHFVFLNLPVLAHMPCLGVIKKSVFYPLLHTHPLQHSVAVHPSLRSRDIHVGGPPPIDQLCSSQPKRPGQEPTGVTLGDFDYVMIIYADYATDQEAAIDSRLTPVWAGEHVHLYRVKSKDLAATPQRLPAPGATSTSKAKKTPGKL